MYIEREISESIKSAARSFPSIILTGPRQSGKTTLLKHIFPNAAYVTFDDPVQREFAADDPKGFLDRFTEDNVILDEIQYVPGMFSYLKMKIDGNRNVSGKWIMTGSQHFAMMKNVSDSLAGRIAVFSLLPLSYTEIASSSRPEISIEDYLWDGAYPEIIVKPQIRTQWIISYVQTYIERDVRQIVTVGDLTQFQQFLSICATLLSKEINQSNISGDCGISVPTVKRWLSILEISFIIFKIPPFHNNLKKRLVKSSKLFFYDTAIVALLTKHQTKHDLFNGAMSGAFFESFIISEIVKLRNNSSDRDLFDIYFWRTRDGMEIDLILEYADRLIPVEIKKTATPSKENARQIEKFIAFDNHSKKVEKGYVVCTAKERTVISKNVTALPWQYFIENYSTF